MILMQGRIGMDARWKLKSRTKHLGLEMKFDWPHRSPIRPHWQGIYNSWKSWKSTGILKSPGNPGNLLEFCGAPGKINKLIKKDWVTDPIDGARRRETGSLFHSDGPATANAHRPNELDILASRWMQSQPLCNTVPTRPSFKHLLQWRSTLLFNFPIDATASFMNPSEFNKLLEIYQNYSWKSWKSTGNLFLRFCRHPDWSSIGSYFKYLWTKLRSLWIFVTWHRYLVSPTVQ